MTAIGLLLVIVGALYAILCHKKGRMTRLATVMGLAMWAGAMCIVFGVIAWIWRVMP